MTNKTENGLTRRQAMKTLAAVSGAISIASLPSRWHKPIVKIGAVPAHAQVSRCNLPGALYATLSWASEDLQLILVEPSFFRVHPAYDGAVSPNTGATHGGNATNGGIETIIMPPGGANNDPGNFVVRVDNNTDSSIEYTVTICTECGLYDNSTTISGGSTHGYIVQFPGGCVTD